VQSVLAQTLCLQNGNVKAIMQHGLKKSIKPLVQVTQRDADVADLPLNPSKSLAYLFPR
jgi:ABC-type xylose transport system substrate-binding protein